VDDSLTCEELVGEVNHIISCDWPWMD